MSVIREDIFPGYQDRDKVVKGLLREIVDKRPPSEKEKTTLPAEIESILQTLCRHVRMHESQNPHGLNEKDIPVGVNCTLFGQSIRVSAKYDIKPLNAEQIQEALEKETFCVWKPGMHASDLVLLADIVAITKVTPC